MKKPSKEQIAEWSRNYMIKNKKIIAERRRVVNPVKNNNKEILTAIEQQKKNKEIFDKSYFGRMQIITKII